MKTYLLFLSLLSSSFLIAQIEFNTGNAEFDADLNIINTNAKKDLTGFKTDLSVSFGVSIDKIDGMLEINMEPGEIYLAFEIAGIAKVSVDKVIESYKINKDKGWGYIAKEMGIKPGSPEFHQLKGKSKEKKEKSNEHKNGKGNNGNGSGNAPGKRK